jgi:enhancing lycopene biosynthesis protein 2
MKKFAVVLAGCGVYDGAEIHEAVLTLLAIHIQGCSYQIFAPDVDQYHVINHLTGDAMPEKRNVLIESARIARGKILPLTNFSASDYDVLIFPGGFGVAKNLCNYAFKDHECTVHPEVASTINDMYKAGKPIGSLCISPVMLAKVIGNKIQLTIGNDESTANDIIKMGAIHQKTGHNEVIIDQKHKVVTSPCYMLNANIEHIYQGTSNAVKALIDLC